MRFLVISGRSGSGKTSALHLLEDEGFTCIDNIPVSLLPTLIDYVSQQVEDKFAIGIDARNLDADLGKLADVLKQSSLPRSDYRVVYLDTRTEVLFKRFSETRRRHPLSDETTDLGEALAKERERLEPVVNISDLTIDTTAMNLHQLRSTLRKLVVGAEIKGMAIMFLSFGFKYGVPTDADFIFDVRSLPNPHWEPTLRMKSGQEKEVQDFLAAQDQVSAMLEDIGNFISKWIPSFQDNNRSYLTIAIGCTGGMHRSVYISERLGERLKQTYQNVQVRHRHLQQRKTDSAHA